MNSDLKRLLVAKYTLDRPLIADKAVVCMALLRLDRMGQRGVGPNRDDAPIFAKVAADLATGNDAKQRRWQARHRVRKYHRQLNRCEYAPMVFSNEPINTILGAYSARLFEVETEHHESQQQENYGGW
jgi:hypothetical protein